MVGLPFRPRALCSLPFRSASENPPLPYGANISPITAKTLREVLALIFFGRRIMRIWSKTDLAILSLRSDGNAGEVMRAASSARQRQ